MVPSQVQRLAEGVATDAASKCRGWFIYPLGGFLGRLLGAVDDVPLKLIYNVADFANTTFGMLQLCSALADAEIGQVRPRHRCCECGGKFTDWVCPRCTGLLCGQCWQAHRQRCLCGGLIGDGAGLNRSTLPGEVVGSEASWASSGRACFVEHVFVEHFVAC